MSEKKPGKDNFTRYLVIGVVVAVVAIMVVPTVISKTKSVSQEIPSTVTSENGYASMKISNAQFVSNLKASMESTSIHW
jgi:ABC-type phosphate transport system permease subunit